MTPIARVLDLYACAGAASVGYHRAGLQPYGIELDPNRAFHYPFPVFVGDVFGAGTLLLEGRALPFVRPEGRRRIRTPQGKTIGLEGDYEMLTLHEFLLKHSSPPCQGYTRGNAVRRATQTKWPRLIEPTRDLLQAMGGPYVIENVADATPHLHDPVRLCACMFDLSTTDDDGTTIHLQRPRMFEANFEITPPRECEGKGRPRWHHPSQEWVAGAYGGARRDKHDAKNVRHGGYVPPNKAVVKALLGIDENHAMTWSEVFEAIPPAYTEHIGHALMRATERTS